MVAGMASALIALGLGLFSMARGNNFNKKYGNLLMQLRVVFQFVAIISLLMMIYVSR